MSLNKHIFNIPKNLKCVFFDMDGVLYDSLKNHEISWTAAFKDIDIDFPAYSTYLYEGKPGLHTIEEVIKKHLGASPNSELIKSVYENKKKYISQLPAPKICTGMDILIPMLRDNGIGVWVVTGSQQPTLLSKLNKDFGMLPEQIISAKDVTQGKPHPDPYLKAVELSGFNNDECLVVENAPLGVQAGKAAGITTIAVNTGILEDKILADKGADIVLPGTAPLIPLFKKFLNI